MLEEAYEYIANTANRAPIELESCYKSFDSCTEMGVKFVSFSK